MSDSRTTNCGSALPGATATAESKAESRPEGRSHKSAQQEPPHSSALRRGRWSWPGYCYFITSNCAGKLPLLADSRCALVVIESLGWLQEVRRTRLMGFVVMPDHVHVAFVLGGDGESRPEGRSHNRGVSPKIVGAPFRARPTLASVMNSFKGFTGKRINELLHRHGEVWQPAYHDHLVRDREDFVTRLSYMDGNPVRNGFVRSEHEFEFSSANPRYAGLVDWAWLDGVEAGRARKGAPTI